MAYSNPAWESALTSTDCALLLCRRSGTICWSNPKARDLLGPGSPPVEGGAAPSNTLGTCPLFGGRVLPQILQTRYWNAIELSAPPEKLTHKHPLALVVELQPTPLPPSPDSESLLLIIVPPLAPGEQSSLADREEFLATAAHDLKNPLSAIFSSADALLESGLSRDLPEQSRAVVARIRATAARSVDLVRNYQQLAELSTRRAVAPGQRIEGLKADLNIAVRTVLDDTFREDPSAHKVSARLGTGPLVVAIERLPLERVVANLFLNAVRYTPRGGTISLSTAPDGSHALFQITNSGAVIPAKELPRLFTRRFRGSTSAGTSGTGLGLFIVKGIVEQFGGEVRVRSDDVIAGTTFEVRLPLAQ